MDLTTLVPGDRVRTKDGATAEVVKESEDGQWVLVKYLEAPGDVKLVGTEDLCHEDEIEDIVVQAN